MANTLLQSNNFVLSTKIRQEAESNTRLSARLSQEHQLKMFYLTEQFKEHARWEEMHFRRQLQNKQFASGVFYEKTKNTGEPSEMGKWVSECLPGRPAPFVIVSTNAFQQDNPFKGLARIAALAGVAKKLREYNGAAEDQNQLSLITTRDYFSSEKDVRTFFNREINCPCILVFSLFTGSSYDVYMLHAGMTQRQKQTMVESTASMPVIDSRIQLLWETPYTFIQNHIDLAKKNGSNPYAWLSVLEDVMATFVGIKVQALLDEYYANDITEHFRPQALNFFNEKKELIRQFKQCEALEKEVTSQTIAVVRQQDALKKLLSVRHNSQEVCVKLSAFDSASIFHTAEYKWGFKGPQGEKIFPFLFFWGGMEEPRFSSGALKLKDSRGKVGFIDRDGRLMVPFEYEEADQMSENHAAVRRGAKWGLVNHNGKEVVPFVFDDLHSPENGYLAFKRSENWGFLNLEGDIVIDARFSDWRKAREQLEVFKTQACSVELARNSNSKAEQRTLTPVQSKGLWGFADISGREVFACCFSKVSAFEEERAFVQLTEHARCYWAIVDANGNILVNNC